MAGGSFLFGSLYFASFWRSRWSRSEVGSPNPVTPTVAHNKFRPPAHHFSYILSFSSLLPTTTNHTHSSHTAFFRLRIPLFTVEYHITPLPCMFQSHRISHFNN